MSIFKISLDKNNNKNRLKKSMSFFIIFFVFVFFGLFLLSMYIPPVLAQGASDGLGVNSLQETGLLKTDLKIAIMNIIRVVLGFLGIIAVIMIIYAGFLWMMSGGNEEKYKKAKQILINAAIGLIIVLSAFIIVHFVITAFLEKEGGSVNSSCVSGTCMSCHQVCNAEGTGSEYTPGCSDSCVIPLLDYFVVKWVDPKNEEKDVALCRAIQVGFNNKLNPDTINADRVLIKIKDGKNEEEICNLNKDCASGKCETNKCIGKTVEGDFTVMEDVFKFRAKKDFEENTAYQVEITTNVKSIKNIAIRATDLKRKWIFATGLTTDTTPPFVEKVFPEDGEKDVCLATPIEAKFSEPMDVISLMSANIIDPITKTVDLTKNTLNINPVISTGFSHNVSDERTLIANPNENYQKNIKYTPILNSSIITDSCGNFLDGNDDGKAEKSPIDDYAPPPEDSIPDWSFFTGTQPYCKPEITNITSNGYYDGNEITITGNYFTLAGNVNFNSNTYAIDSCFDNDFYPMQKCISSWEDKQIKLKIPSGGGTSNGSISGGVWIETGIDKDGNEILSNSKNFEVLSPHINWISSKKGGAGQPITISGSNFGDTQGDVYFVNKTNHKLKSKAQFPCEKSWQDNQIIIKIPEQPALALNSYYIQIVVKKDSESVQKFYYSNVEDFEVNTQFPGPLICELVPKCGLVGNSVTIKGEKFGLKKDKVYLNETSIIVDDWLATEIKTKVPKEIKEGASILKVKVGETESNGLSFLSPCGLGASCDLDKTTPSCDLGACSEGEFCSADDKCTCKSVKAHCTNLSQDKDKGEEGIDCGGKDCDACKIACKIKDDCPINQKCCSDKFCASKCSGDACQVNLDCNSSLVSVPGQTWEGGFEENKDEWKMNSQKHSFVKRETIDTAYGGGTAIHIHQDPNQSYEGICDKETCEDMPWCSWLSETNQCKFIKRPDFCHLGAIDSIYNQEETLCWVNSHRVMWLSLTYNTAPLKLVVGKKYTYSFYYKGHSAGNLNIKITPSIGWDSLCTNEAWYVANYPSKICPDQPGYYCAYAPVQKKCYQADKALGSVPAGNYSDWTKFTSTFIYTEELSKTVNQNSELINEIGMSMGYNDTGANGTDLFIDNVQLEEGDASSNLTCCGNICKAINQCRVYLPVIDNISPDNGMVLNPATTYVTIRGKNFGQTQGQNKVLFGDKEAGLACQSWSDTEIIVIAPFGISGVVPIKIVTDQGSSIGKNFTINNIVRPSICSLSPNHGKAGDKITISGTNFGDAQINGIYKSQVFFDNKEVVVNSWINGKIEIAVPNGITVSEPKVKVVLKWKDAPNGVDSNEVSFYINPFINNITPDKGPKDSYVTIRGRNFGNTQGQSKILFNNIPAVLAPCKGAWSDDEIIALAPNSETGSVVVKVILPNGQEIFSNNDKIFTYNNDLLAPGICEISPDNGSVDASVKITGSNFGATALVNEGVFFNQVKATVSLNNWTNSQINTNVPQTTSGDVVVTKIGQRDTGKKECVGGISILGVCIGGQNEIIYEAVVLKSNPVWFEVIKTTCGDNKREELEICDGTDLDSKTCANFDSMSGDGLKCKTDCFGFDTTQCKGSPGVCGDGIINSGETCDKTNFGNKKCSDFSSYISGNLLCDNSCQFNYSGCNIYINGSNGNGSNGLQCVPEEAVCGNSCCLANECENRVCKVEPEIVKHWPNCKDVCINAQIDTQFNIDMVSTIFNSSTVELKKCTDNTETCSSLGSQELTSLEITYSNSTKELFINKALNLVQNQWYKVIIKGGENGVKGLNGKILKQDFSWVFKTKNSKCEVDRTKVIPYIHNMYISETYDYLTEAYGSPDSCSSDGQKLAIIDGYKWKSCLGSNVDSCSATCASGGGIGKIENEATESSNIAKITAKARGNTQVCSFYKLLKSSGALTILSKYNCKEGETECVNGCCAQACNASGNCPVLAPYLSSKPDIIAQSPIGYNVCTNKEISATFNQIINKETLNNQNIFLTKNDILVEGDIISRDENNKTTIIFSSKVNLEKNIEYKMTIKKEVKNRDDLTMENDKAWTFKTGATLCQIDHIKIMINGKEKNNDSFTCADDNCVDDQVSITPRNQHNYIAQAQDKNNENILASYVWDKQDANGILSIVDSKNPTQTVTSQRKNGEAIVSVQANAGDIPSKSMEIKVTSLMCENPWKFTDSANVGLDSDTGFEILYCKDR